MARESKFFIRQAKPSDLPAIYDLMAEFDMFGEFEADTCLVAKNAGDLWGFIRLECVENRAYIRPIVVGKKHQGKGIGQALIRSVMGKHPQLVAIARGDAVGFYTRLGFSPIHWTEVYSPFQDECSVCPDLGSCKPIPLGLVAD